MNILSIAGFLMAAAVAGIGIHAATPNPWVFLDEHAILIVMGGTLAAASVAFQLDRLFLMFRTFFYRVIRGRKFKFPLLLAELMRLAEAFRVNDMGKVEQMLKDTPYHFLREAMTLGMEGVLPRDHLEKVLRTRIASQYHRYSEEATKFRTVGKYPPAFGLMGTTLGMISLLQKIGQPGAQKLLGPSMSVALIATFYGISFTNFVFGPISENLMDSAKETKLMHSIILAAVLLILDKTNPLVMSEELNSFLLPGERMDWKKVSEAGADGAAKEAA